MSVIKANLQKLTYSSWLLVTWERHHHPGNCQEIKRPGENNQVMSKSQFGSFN